MNTPYPGEIRHFDQYALMTDPRVAWNVGSRPSLDIVGIECRPFLCVSAAGGRSRWTPITTRGGSSRVALKRRWCGGPRGRWTSEPQFVKDPATYAEGPDEVFGCPDPGQPQCLVMEGVRAVQEAMKRAAGRSVRWDGTFDEPVLQESGA
jgi:hypothetical protein